MKSTWNELFSSLRTESQFVSQRTTGALPMSVSRNRIPKHDSKCKESRVRLSLESP